MPEDVIRCYIGNISFHTLRSVTKESGKCPDWEYFDGSQFNLEESYGYHPSFDRDETLLKALSKRAVIAENRQPDQIPQSLFWTNAPDIQDIVTLLSLARANYYPVLSVERNIGNHYSISWGIRAPETSGTWDILPLAQIGQFISDAMDHVAKNPSWLESSGFTPSLYWYVQAQIARSIAPTALEIALYWVALEVLAGVYVDSQNLTIYNKKDRVKRLLQDIGYGDATWSFLDSVIDECYQVRNYAFHEGTDVLTGDNRGIKRQQLRDLVSLILINMLVPQDTTVNQAVAEQIQQY